MTLLKSAARLDAVLTNSENELRSLCSQLSVDIWADANPQSREAREAANARLDQLEKLRDKVLVAIQELSAFAKQQEGSVSAQKVTEAKDEKNEHESNNTSLRHGGSESPIIHETEQKIEKTSNFHTFDTQKQARELDEETPHFLGEMFVRTKPSRFSFWEKDYNVKTWADIYLKICKILSAKFQEEFNEFALKMKGKKRHYFSKNPKELYASSLEMIGNVYAEMNLGANSLAENLSRLFSHFNIPVEELRIYLYMESASRQRSRATGTEGSHEHGENDADGGLTLSEEDKAALFGNFE